MRLLLACVLLAGLSLRVWYAAYGLNENRFWDERYNFENVESILETGSLRPAKVYYPSPLVSWPQAGLLAASEALHDATGRAALAIRNEDGFAPSAYLVCRLLSVAYGVAALWLLFVIARSVFGDRVALLAALALAFLPWHIHASGKFKPDALVVLTVLLAFHWSLRAVRRRSIPSYALAGFGIALALSGKVTGGVIALSLVAGAAADREAAWLDRVKLVAIAGVVSVVAFVAMNPYGRWYLDFVSGLRRDYEMRAGWSEEAGFIPVETLRYILGDFVHGPVVGAVALAAVLIAAFGIGRGGIVGRERTEWLMLLTFPIAFTAAYTAATPYFKGNNFLPIVPFTCMVAAWAGWHGWRWAASRLQPAGRSLLGGGLAAGAIALVVAPGYLYVYRSLVPSAIDLARLAAVSETRAPAGRFYYLESAEENLPIWEGREALLREYPGFRETAALRALSEDRLDLSDGELFPGQRLEGERGAFYRGRLERTGEANRRMIAPRWFRVRGPAAVALLHRRPPGPESRLLYRGRCQPGRNCFGFEIEGAGPGGLVSLEISVPTAAVDPHQTELGVSVDGRDLDTVRVGIRGMERAFLTERFRLVAAAMEIRLTDVEPRLVRRQIGFKLLAWGENES